MSTVLVVFKIVGCVALLGLLVVAINLKNNNVEFESYLEKFNKTPKNEEERSKLYAAFENSLKTINNLNSNRNHLSSARYGLTKFSSLTPEEFAATLLKPKNPKQPLYTASANTKTTRPFVPPSNIPLRLDWRDSGIVTPVKNQKQCGACWAFSVVELVESMAALVNHRTPAEELSVQQMIDCAGNGNWGCIGGDTCLLLEWLNATKTGIVTEKEYVTDLKEGKCRVKTVGKAVIDDFKCKSYLMDESEILRQLITGPVAVAINAISWQNYLSGVIQYHCDASLNLLNHAVQIVGYDLSADIPHYIVRNSWGEDFGDGGYLYIAIGRNLCGLANEVATVKLR